MKRSLFSLAAAFAVAAPMAAQQAPRVTVADYDRASAQLAPSLTDLVVGGSVQANWLPDDRLWYRTAGANAQTILINPVAKTRTVCDATRSNCAGVPATADAAGGGRGGRGGGVGGGGRGGATGNAVASPDGKRAAFIKDYNLWVRDVATNQEKALTTDGVKDFGYATDNAGWASSDRAILLWYPTPKKSRPRSRMSGTLARCIWWIHALAIQT